MTNIDINYNYIDIQYLMNLLPLINKSKHPKIT